MTELLIEGKRVVLPKDMSITLNEDNPEVTSNGEYTWDITASLKNKVNKRIFNHLNRLNLSAINTTLNAMLIIDRKVRRGQVIILSNTDIDIKFQFVAGNSELNYIAQNDTKIWEYDFGKEDTAIDFTRAFQSLSYPGYGNFSGYQNNFVCTPVILGSDTANDYTINTTVVPIGQINGINDKIIMQPYLLYYINKLPEVLNQGYTWKYNALNDDARAKKMFIINSVNSLKYSDALPDMTVSEFISAIENFFNISFVVDPTDRTISIKSVQSSISSRKTVKPIVFDTYERNMDETSDPLKIDFTKISYELSSSNYFKYNKLSDDILACCDIKEFDNLAAIYDYILPLSFNAGNELIIYRDKQTDNDWILTPNVSPPEPAISLYGEKIGGFMLGTEHYISLINKFKSYNLSSDKELVLKLKPAEMNSVTKTWTENIGGTSIKAEFRYQLPKISNEYFIATESGFIDLVEKGTSTIQRSTDLEVSLYQGVLEAHSHDTTLHSLYPFSSVDTYPEFFPYDEVPVGLGTATEIDATWYNNIFKPTATKSMRITGPSGILSDYHQTSLLDTSKQYTFTMLETQDTNAGNLFLINNKKYMPITFEHTVTIDGFKKTVTGKFYALK